MKNDRYYMHPVSGDVQTGEDWQADKESMAPEMWGDGDNFLIEVEKVNGEWEEV